MTTYVIKISGHELDDNDYLRAFSTAVKALNAPCVIVHGGGKEISALQTERNITPQYVDGVRLTDAPSLAIVQMVLAGSVNKRLVSHLVWAGVDAIGVSGVDGGLVRADPLPTMGFTGQVRSVRADLLRAWLDAGLTPTVAPLCLGDDSVLNVNADPVAAGMAAALTGARLVFLSNVRGVLANDQVIPLLNAPTAEAMIADGRIFGGMIPKIRAALGALAAGAASVLITDLAGFRDGTGTVLEN
jgi:acetylglutamate kinase